MAENVRGRQVHIVCLVLVNTSGMSVKEIPLMSSFRGRRLLDSPQDAASWSLGHSGLLPACSLLPVFQTFSCLRINISAGAPGLQAHSA